MKVGALASGSGTNLQALIDAASRSELGPARLVVVGANVPGCGALERATQAGIPTFLLSHKDFATREDFDHALLDELRRHGVGLVALAGFMRILTPAFLDAFPHRVVNIHPALLPSFPGVHAQKQAFDGAVRFSGCTVHFVDAGTDTGPIIAQAVVPVLDGDDEEALRLRILAEEHRLYPTVIRAIAEGRVTVDGRRVNVRGTPTDLANSRLRSL
jgi:phosphoribosylglycinamide formyltransferase-1